MSIAVTYLQKLSLQTVYFWDELWITQADNIWSDSYCLTIFLMEKLVCEFGSATVYINQTP